MEQNIEYLQKRIAELKAEKERHQKEHQLKHQLWSLEHPTMSRLGSGLRNMGSKVGSGISQGMGQIHDKLHEKTKSNGKKKSGFKFQMPNVNTSMLSGRNPRLRI